MGIRLIIASLLLIAAFPHPIRAQSRLPGNANNWLQNSGTPVTGDTDRVNVIFFEVPDTLTSPLYFGIRDAGADNVSPDENIGVSNFYLVGGLYTISDPNSRLRDYTANRALARTGTVWSTLESDNTAAYNNGNWSYFPQSVSPSQGEHIGGMYYFKIVVEAAPDVEITDFTCVADVGGSLSGRYFRISSPTVNYYVWYNTGFSVDPAAANPGRTGIQASISIGDTASVVAAKTAAALNAYIGGTIFTGTSNGSVVRIRSVGTDLTASAWSVGNSGFTMDTRQVAGPSTISKNAYQVDISYSGTGTPTGVTGVRSFAYSWTVCFLSTSTWDFYPFVPENANATAAGNTDYVVYLNFDQEGETNAASSRTGKAPRDSTNTAVTPAVSGDNVTAATAYSIYFTNVFLPATNERNGTWDLTVTEGAGGEPTNNTTEVWFTLDADTAGPLGDGPILRTYASPFTNPPSPNSVAITYEDGTALANNVDLETIYLQIVDNTGAAASYSRDIYVTLSDASAVIDQISAGTNNGTNALITTDVYGFGYLKVRRPQNGINNGETFPVTTTAYWDGVTGGSDLIGPPGGSGSILVTFYEDPAPTISSASNLSFTEGPLTSLPVITIADSGLNNITAALELYIRIPSGLNAVFNPVAPSFGGTGVNSSRVTGYNYLSGNTILQILVGTNFDVTSTLTVSGLQFAAGSTDSSGRLELSYNGGTAYPVQDDKLITIADTGGSYTWIGATSTTWGTGTNWAGGAAPTLATDNVTITNPAASFQPTLPAGGVTLNNLVIESTATLTTGNNSLTVAALTCDGALNAALQTTPRTVSVTGNLGGQGTITGGTGPLSFGASTLLRAAISTSGGSITFSGAVVLGRNTTVTSSGGAINFGGTINGAYTLTLTAGAGTITLSGAIGGTTSVVNLTTSGSGAFAIPATTLSGNLSVTTTGVVTQGGVLTIGGTSSIATGGATITLVTATNDFTGAVSLTNTGANAVSVTDANAIQLGAQSLGTGAFTVTAGAGGVSGGITQTATAIAVPGTSSFDGGPGVITLNTVGNNFTGAVALSNSGANAVTIRDSGAIQFAACSLGTGTLTVTAGGAITQTATAITQSAGAGAASFITTAAPITLTSTTNNFTGTVSFTTTLANAVSVTDANAIQLGAQSLGTGAFTVTAGAGGVSGGITQTAAAIAVPGTSSFDGGPGVITLNTVGNNFTGAVALSNSGANAVSITDANAIQLGACSLGTGALTVTAGAGGSGTITQTATAITQSAGAGAASFTTTAAAITLTSTTNDFTGPVSLTTTLANAVSVTDANDLQMGACSLGTGTLTVTAGAGGAGTITQTVTAITQSAGAGAASFITAAAVITLNSATNDFTGPVSFTTTGGNSVSVTDANAIQLGAQSLGTGTFTVTAGAGGVSGGITQTAAALLVPGAATFDGGPGVITLTNTTNNFQSSVALSNSGANAVSVTDTNAIQIGACSLGTGTLTVTAGAGGSGTITQTATAITQSAGAGAASFITTAAAITLTSTTNDFTGAVSFTTTGANAVSVTDANAIQLGAQSLGSGAFTVTAGAGGVSGGITQTATAIAVPGTSSFDGGPGVITLNTVGNNFTGAVALSNSGANAVDIRDSGTIQFAACSLGTGAFTVTAGGAITQTATAITQSAGAGAASFITTAAPITLASNTNDFTGPVSFTTTGANAVSVTDANAIQLGAQSLGTGAFTVTAGAGGVSGGITQTAAAITVPGAASFNGGPGVITLSTAGNDFQGTVALSNSGANAVDIRDANNIDLAAVAVGYDLTFTAGGTVTPSADLTSSRDLTINIGILSTNSFNITATRSLAGTGTLEGVAGAPQEIITVGGDFTVTGYTANETRVILNGATTPSNVSSHTFYDLTINKTNPGDSVVSTGSWTVTNTLTMTRGTWNGGSGAYTHEIRNSWDSTSVDFTFTPSDSTIDISTQPSLNINTRAANVFWNLTISTDVTLLCPIVVLNDLTITGTLDVRTGFNYQVTVGRNWDNTGTFNCYLGRVVFNNNGSIQNAETFYDLEKSGAGTTTSFNGNLTIIDSVRITTGTLAEGGPGAYDIILGDQPTSPATVVWENLIGNTGFSGGNGRVIFANQTIRILGDTTFFVFWCDTGALGHAVALRFDAENTQTITSNFSVVGNSTDMITLQSDSGTYTPPPPDDGALTNIFPLWTWNQQWGISLLGTAQINFVRVQASVAVGASITPTTGCVNLGYNQNWYFFIPITASWTLDANNNGRIDRIRVKVLPNTLLSDNFGALDVSVQGYAVTGFGTAAGAGDDVFDILLQEGMREDTDAAPRWQLLANPPPGLFGTVGGAFVEFGSTTYTPNDGARPVITYTLAAAGSNRAYAHFSEPVYGDPAQTTQLGAGSLAYSAGAISGVQSLETSGIAAHAVMLTLPAALTVNDILLASAQALNAAAGQVWGAQAAADPAAYARVNLDGNLPPNAARSALATLHNVSDVGLNLITPVFAYDLTVSQDVVRGGIGKTTVFDGTGWMRPRDTLLEARLLGVTGTVTIHWDVNAVDPILLGNLWIPQTATTLFPAGGSDRYHNANTQGRSALQSAAPGALRDFTIPGNDSEFANGAVLQFMFTIDDGAGNILPCAYVADLNDPTTAAPWSCTLRELEAQRANVTITNNMINPDLGQTANLHYVMPQAGRVTITVFDLKGDVVDVLFNGTKAAGEHTTAWNGKNRGGRSVARGIYFMRVVGPGFDEFRKVLVVR